MLYGARYYENAHYYLNAQSESPSDDEIQLAGMLKKRCTARPSRSKPRVLEIGCGAGRLLDAFGQRGWEAIGLDMSPLAVETAIQRGLDARAAEIDDPTLGLFDLVASFHTLEHLHKPMTFLRNCADRLVENGCILLEVPDYGSRLSRNLQAEWPSLYPELHLYQFTEETISRYLKTAGLKVESLQRVGGKGPFEIESGPAAKDTANRTGGQLQVLAAVKTGLFALRKLFWWSRTARKLARSIIWNHFGYGDYLRVLARKI
jgi:SAM-dependent methyltransferase